LSRIRLPYEPEEIADIVSIQGTTRAA
jgi:hypothetical protein